MHDGIKLRLQLNGYPVLFDGAGKRVNIRSRKSIALLALLATSELGERSRAWLQQKLWGGREPSQAQASLRRELSNLRKVLATPKDWLQSDHMSVRINLDLVDVDIHRPVRGAHGEFLEGIDIPGADDFEDWLREMRNRFKPGESGADPLSARG